MYLSSRLPVIHPPIVLNSGTPDSNITLETSSDLVLFSGTPPKRLIRPAGLTASSSQYSVRDRSESFDSFDSAKRIDLAQPVVNRLDRELDDLESNAMYYYARLKDNEKKDFEQACNRIEKKRGLPLEHRQKEFLAWAFYPNISVPIVSSSPETHSRNSAPQFSAPQLRLAEPPQQFLLEPHAPSKEARTVMFPQQKQRGFLADLASDNQSSYRTDTRGDGPSQRQSHTLIRGAGSPLSNLRMKLREGREKLSPEMESLRLETDVIEAMLREPSSKKFLTGIGNFVSSRSTRMEETTSPAVRKTSSSKDIQTPRKIRYKKPSTLQKVTGENRFIAE